MKNLKTLEFGEINLLAEPITNPTLKSILKYRKHRRVIATGDLNIRSYFQFSRVSVDAVFKGIKKLSPRETTQSTDVTLRVLKDNAKVFADYICRFFNKSINSASFHLSKSFKIVVWF